MPSVCFSAVVGKDRKRASCSKTTAVWGQDCDEPAVRRHLGSGLRGAARAEEWGGGGLQLCKGWGGKPSFMSGGTVGMLLPRKAQW